MSDAAMTSKDPKEMERDEKMDDAVEKKMEKLRAIYLEWVEHEDWNSRWPSVAPKTLADFAKEYYSEGLDSEGHRGADWHCLGWGPAQWQLLKAAHLLQFQFRRVSPINVGIEIIEQQLTFGKKVFNCAFLNWVWQGCDSFEISVSHKFDLRSDQLLPMTFGMPGGQVLQVLHLNHLLIINCSCFSHYIDWFTAGV